MRVQAYFCEWEDQHVLEDGTIKLGCITYPVVITDESSASSYGIPVVEIDGEARGPAEMPSGELQIPAEHFEALCPTLTRVGYAVCDAPVTDYWRKRWEAGTPVDHWHPEARLVSF